MQRAMEENLRLDTYMQGCEAVTHLVFAGKNKHTWPTCIPEFHAQFIKENPNALVILPIRNMDDMVKSIKRWGDLWDRWRKSAPNLAWDASEDEFRHWITLYYANIRTAYLHHLKYIEYEIEDSTARERIEEALGQQITWWGKANVWKPGMK